MYYQLKSHVAVEPLVARYAASPYLLSPASSPRFFRRLVEGLLASFVKAPRAHELALKNPAMKGGPFVTLPASRASEGAELLTDLRSKLGGQLAVATALDELVTLLKQAEGQPLDELVQAVPQPLKGLVELYYERSGKASYRMVEGLAYEAEWHDEALQEILLYPLQGDAREFILTTPRVAESDRLFLRLPLKSRAIDELAAARHEPIDDVAGLARRLGVTASQMALFTSFFEPASSQPKPRTPPRGLRTRYFGHACVEVTSPVACVVVDPFISYAVPGKDDGRLTLQDLPPRIDALVITHLHLDHFCIETLLQLRHKVGCVIVPKSPGGTSLDPSAKRILASLGFEHVVELGEMEAHAVADLRVKALPFHGEHGDLDIASKATFLVSSAERSVLFAADARVADHALLERVARSTGKVDLIFLGMESEGAPLSWVYGPLLDTPLERKWDQVRRLNGSNAELGLRLTRAFGSSKARVYALGREPWLSHVMAVDQSPDSPVQREIESFVGACAERDVEARLLYLEHEEEV